MRRRAPSTSTSMSASISVSKVEPRVDRADRVELGQQDAVGGEADRVVAVLELVLEAGAALEQDRVVLAGVGDSYLAQDVGRDPRDPGAAFEQHGDPIE